MFSSIVIESKLLESEIGREVIQRFKSIPLQVCASYTEVFNALNHDFRIQKKFPALIVAEKKGKRIHPTPEGYGIGHRHNFYFSHMLNCLYDCRYCFLQGMYASANYVWFVNNDDFVTDIESTIAGLHNEEVCFFSGYDCDSLAMERVTGFAQFYLEKFSKYENAFIEFRTKSVNIRHLLDRAPIDNAIIAFSVMPEALAEKFDVKAPPLYARLESAKKLANRGWNVGFRIDPIIDVPGLDAMYTELVDQLTRAVEPERIHSLSVGSMRFPKNVFRRIEKMFPDEPLFSVALENRNGVVAYEREREKGMHSLVVDTLKKRIAEEKIFACWADVENISSRSAPQTESFA